MIMKKITILISSAILCAVSIMSAFRNEDISDSLFDANIEALAQEETEPYTGKWKRIHDELGCYKHHICAIDGDGYVCGPIGSTTYLP